MHDFLLLCLYNTQIHDPITTLLKICLQAIYSYFVYMYMYMYMYMYICTLKIIQTDMHVGV